MIIFSKKKTNIFCKKTISSFILICFFVSQVALPSRVNAQAFLLSAPGVPVTLTSAFRPVSLSGINIYPDNPFKFDFIVDQGDLSLKNETLRAQASQLIKYFLASLTVPEAEMWVNLSPYEKNRIVPEAFGKTEMGRDLLAQDYMLKQLTASLMNPEGNLGKNFWQKMDALTKEKSGGQDVPKDTFHKVWIVPEQAVIYVHAKGAFIVNSRLKVLMEEDYEALKHSKFNVESRVNSNSEETTERETITKIMRETILPAIEREVNEGKTFAPLRQIYHSMLLANWYKKALKKSILAQVYSDRKVTKGLESPDDSAVQKIYDQYVQAFKKGVYNMIQEEYDPQSQSVVIKQYFLGGFDLRTGSDFAMFSSKDGDVDGQVAEAVSKIKPVTITAVVGDVDILRLVGQSADRAMMNQAPNPILQLAQRTGVFRRWLIAVIGSLSIHGTLGYLLSDDIFFLKNPKPIEVKIVESDKKEKPPMTAEVVDNRPLTGSVSGRLLEPGEEAATPIIKMDDPDAFKKALEEMYRKAGIDPTEPRFSTKNIFEKKEPPVKEVKLNEEYLKNGAGNNNSVVLKDQPGDGLDTSPVFQALDRHIPDDKKFDVYPIEQIGAVHLGYQDARLLGRAFDAFAVFKEHPKLKGKVLSDKDLDEEFAPWDFLDNDNTGQRDLSIFQGYNADFNELAEFFSNLVKDKVQLNDEQKEVLKYLLDQKILVPKNREYAAAKEGSLIATHRGIMNQSNRLLILRHELGHALFEKDSQYQKDIETVWNGLDPSTQDLLTRLLEYLGYHGYSHLSEFGQYFENPELLLSLLKAMSEEASVYSPGSVVTQERRKMAAELTQEIIEHQGLSDEKRHRGKYLKESFQMVLLKIVPALFSSKEKAMERAGLGPLAKVNLDFQRPLELDTGTPPIRIERNYENITVYTGNVASLLSNIENAPELDATEKQKARSALFSGTKGYSLNDTFSLKKGDKEDTWKVEFVREAGKKSLAEIVQEGLEKAQAFGKQDINIFLKAVREAVAGQPWGDKESFDVVSEVNLGGQLYQLRINALLEHSIIQIGDNVEQRNEWVVSIMAGKKNRNQWWQGNVNGMGRNSELSLAWDKALSDFQYSVEEKRVVLAPSVPVEIPTINKALGWFKKAALSKKGSNKLDLVFQVMFKGELVDLQFIQEGEYWFTTKLGLVRPSDGINSPIIDKLAVIVSSKTREKGIEEAGKLLDEKIEEFTKGQNKSSDPAMLSRREFVISSLAALGVLGMGAVFEGMTGRSILQEATNFFNDPTQKQKDIHKKALAFLKGQIDLILNEGVGFSSTQRLDGWRELFKGLRSKQTGSMLNYDPLINDDDLLEMFIYLFFELFEEAVELTGQKFIDAPENYHKMKELLESGWQGTMPAYETKEVKTHRRFFQNVWTDFIISVSNDNSVQLQAAGQRLINEAAKISAPLESMMKKIVLGAGQFRDKDKAEYLIEEWNNFNKDYLTSQGFYGTLTVAENIEDRKNIYFAVIYKIDRKEQRKILGKKTVDVIYGRKIDLVNMQGELGHSIKGVDAIFIDADDVDVRVRKIRKTLEGKPFVLIPKGEIFSFSVDTWIRQRFSTMDDDKIKVFIEREIRIHELTHKTQELAGVEYALDDPIGMPRNFWLEYENKELITHELAAYLGEMALGDDPVSSLVFLLPDILLGQGTSNDFVGREILNTLAGRPQESWVDWHDINKVMDVFDQLVSDPHLGQKARDLYKKSFPDLGFADPAMTALYEQDGLLEKFAEEKKLGGIDLSPVMGDIKWENEVDFEFPVLSDEVIKSIQMNGLTPVIINMTPTVNLFLMLGLDLVKR